MTLIDTHSHTYDESFDNDIEDIINRAKQAGITNILLPNVDVETIDRVNNLAEKYPEYCIPMMGLHPTSVTENWESDLKIIKEQFSIHKYIAVGEIGIDLYWDKSLEKEQRAAFEEQLRWSIELNLPVSIHCRNAISESIECIKNIGASKLRGAFHSFGGSMAELEAVLALDNFYLGINGTVTYKNSTLPQVLTGTDLSHLIIETDAPYLPPVPYRGKRNEPSYTIHIAAKLAEIYDVTPEQAGEITSANAKKLFSIN
ncbi:TatD DNase family protein [Dysgonomonas alginatilytica]|uniref:TatD DNase family protein n=1 Tax=Dysgonomonas alginatilytica TaxID=1605892 RepID=A0A2V3PQF2_9BACT|nr:TatD family hydrolase [Dysgonomonas alginatilytica]PXV59326.1 TatD DNase family protein [Dysgonomonas alginatilytica]